MRTKRFSRRAFIGAAGAAGVGAVGVGSSWWAEAAAAAVGGAGPGGSEPGKADLVVFNAKVYTVDGANPKAEAFAIRNSRFIAVGSNDQVKNLIGRGTQSYDAQQMTIVPGFIDCHNHAVGQVLVYDVLVGNPFEVEFVTIQSIIDKLSARAKTLPPGTWVDGYFFDDTKVKDKRDLNVHDLDKVSMDHPVAVHHRGGHTTFYNSKALSLAHVTKDTPNPPGGTFDKDEKGNLNGRVTDRAMEVFRTVGQRPTYTAQEQVERARAGLVYISKAFVKYGLTSVHHEGGDLFMLQDVRSAGELRHRVSFETSGKILDAMIDNGIRSGFGDEWIKLGATSEHTVDGSFSERTMAMSTPYLGIKPPYKGNITETQDALNTWMERVIQAGIQPNCHANGDVAIDMVLTAVERALKSTPVKDLRPKITHCTLVTDDLLKRIKALNGVPAAFTSYAYYNADKFHFYGEDRMKHAMAFRSFLDYGINVAAGSDFSPGPFAPLMGIQGMVTRTGWNGETWGANQKVTVDEAIRINTYNGAYNSKEEDIKGSITAGKFADYVVLADDPHSIDPSKIKDIKIVKTVTGGTAMYEA